MVVLGGGGAAVQLSPSPRTYRRNGRVKYDPQTFRIWNLVCSEIICFLVWIPGFSYETPGVRILHGRFADSFRAGLVTAARSFLKNGRFVESNCHHGGMLPFGNAVVGNEPRGFRNRNFIIWENTVWCFSIESLGWKKWVVAILARLRGTIAQKST